MARISSGTPDQARARRSARGMVVAWSSFLNLFIRVIRELMASTSFCVALVGMDG